MHGRVCEYCGKQCEEGYYGACKRCMHDIEEQEKGPATCRAALTATALGLLVWAALIAFGFLFFKRG